MGKTKQPQEQPEKIIRCLGENLSITVSEEEKKYRNRMGPDDVKEIKKDKLKCTVCAKSVADIVRRGVEPFVHMVLGVLVCKDCSSFYGDGYFSVDEDGDDKYCRWCGQGGTLYICSTCSCAFCKKCIKQNLGKQDIKDLESDDWQCFICNPKPLYECRTICWALQEHAEQLKKERPSEDAGNSTATTRSRRDKTNHSSGTVSNESFSNSKKRQASDSEEVEKLDVKKESKRRKISDTKNELKSPKRLEPSPRKTRISKGQEADSEVSSPAKSESRSTRNSISLEDKNTPINKSTRNSKKQGNKNIIEEVILSDEEVVDKDKKNSHKKKKGSSSTKKSNKIELDKKREEIKDARPQRSSSGKKTQNSSSESSTKKSSVEKKSTTPLKHNKKRENNQKKPKQHQYLSDNSEESSKESVSLIGEDSASESENKLRNKKDKTKFTKSNKISLKPQLSIAKDSENTVVYGCGYVNAAINDVVELGVLINSHCEKLCSKIVQSSDDVLKAFHKLKELMGGVTTNLETIEKGLDNKINNWQGITSEDKDQTIEGLETKPTVEGNLHNEVVEECHSLEIEELVKYKEHTISVEESQKEDVTNENSDTIDAMEVDGAHEKKEDIPKENSKINDLMDVDDSNAKKETVTKENGEMIDVMEVDSPLVQEVLMTESNELSENPTKTYNESENERESESNNDEDKIVHIDEPNKNEDNKNSIDYDNKTQSIESEDNDHVVEDSTVDVNPNLGNAESRLEYSDDVGKATEKSNDLDDSNTECCSISENLCSNSEIINNDEELTDKSNWKVSDNEESCNANLHSIIAQESTSDVNNIDETENAGCLNTTIDNDETVNSLASETIVNEADVTDKNINKNMDLQEDGLANSSNNGLLDLKVSISEEEAHSDLNKDQFNEMKEDKLNIPAENNDSSESSNPKEMAKDISTEAISDTNFTSRESEGRKNGIDDVLEKNDLTKVKESKEKKKEQKEENKSSKTSKEEQKTISSSHHTEPPRRSSGSGSYSNQSPQRWSGEHGRDRNHQDRYSSDRWRSGGRSGSWNRYDDRRPSRGGWGWSR